MKSVYEDRNLVLRKHRLSSFDLGYELHPLLDLISPGESETFETRDLIQRTRALAESISEGQLGLVSDDTKLTPALVTLLSLTNESQKVVGSSKSTSNLTLSAFGNDLLQTLISQTNLLIQDTPAGRIFSGEEWRVFWFAKDDRPAIGAAVDFFMHHPDVRGAVFIMGYARSAAGPLMSKSRSRPYQAIENATGLGEIYFL